MVQWAAAVGAVLAAWVLAAWALAEPAVLPVAQGGPVVGHLHFPTDSSSSVRSTACLR